MTQLSSIDAPEYLSDEPGILVKTLNDIAISVEIDDETQRLIKSLGLQVGIVQGNILEWAGGPTRDITFTLRQLPLT